MWFEQITIDHAKMGGLPCIRGLRNPVSTVLGQLAAGRTELEILADYPDPEPGDTPARVGVRGGGAEVTSGEPRGLPIYTGNPDDFHAIDGLTVATVPAP